MGYRRRGPPLEPKPFACLNFSGPRVNRELVDSRLSSNARPPGVGHEKMHESTWAGSFGLLITPITPLHVGTGLLIQQGNHVARETLKDSKGRFVLPATSLKGAVRSVAEMLSNSCLRIMGGALKRDVDWERQPCAEIRAHARARRQQDSQAKLCPCCRIFGALGYQGRVYFSDAVSEKALPVNNPAILEIPAAYPPDRRAKRFKDARGRVRGRKVYYHAKPSQAQGDPYEVLPAGSRLFGKVRVECLTTPELLLVLNALGLFGLRIKIGGGKQAGFGTVRIQTYQLEPSWDSNRPESAFESYDLASKVIEGKALAEWLRARRDELDADRLIDKQALADLTKLWTLTPEDGNPMGRTAPSGAY